MKQPRQTPRIVLSTRAGMIGSLDSWREIATLTRVAGLDLDISSSFRRLMLRAGPWPQALGQPAVRSVWLHAFQLGQRDPQSTVCLESEDAGTLADKTIVIQHDAIRDRDGDVEAAIKAIAQWREDYPASPAPRVAVCLAPTNRSGGRAHLQRIQLIRLLTAEWDVDLALDLLGQVDETWEAEAAVLKIVPRLRIVRIPYPIELPGTTARERMTRRVLTAAIDGGFDGIVSLAPPIRPWQTGRRQVLLETTADAVIALRREMRKRGHVTLEPPWRESTF